MGVKRKASFEDSSLSPSSQQSFPASSQSSSAQTAASSVDRPLNMWNIAGAPYFNSRTRKRFRDGRPDEETIHQKTLSKLFDAQKQQRNTAQNHDRDTSNSNLLSSPNPRLPATVEPILGPANLVEVPRSRNQRSLDAFFGIGPSWQNSSDERPQLEYAAQPPLPSSIYQPQDRVQHLIPPHPRSLPSILTCEDCDASLLTKSSGEAVDAEMLDVDGLAFLDPEVNEGWACAICAKRVCDVCAVRGDCRVCLECAVPRSGRYQQEEIQEKRWVGGIGWM